MIKKTKDYNIFKFRDDNRLNINQSHLNKICESIKHKNLLEYRPISVNKNMEVIDGQHRLLAAQKLYVEIYYEIGEDLDSFDIILMNINKSWSPVDFLNFYCKNNYIEYQKLDKFIKETKISLKVALSLIIGRGKNKFHEFKKGEFKFELVDDKKDYFNICWDTIEFIIKKNGNSPYTKSSRFWEALISVVKHGNFNREKWMENLSKVVERFCPKISILDYKKLMIDTHNYRNNLKISLYEELSD